MFQCFKAPSSGSLMWACWIVAQSCESRTGWGLYIVTVCAQNCCPKLWKQNRLRAVYCDRLCTELLPKVVKAEQVEGCILWPSVDRIVAQSCESRTGWGLYIVTVCAQNCCPKLWRQNRMRAVYCDRLCTNGHNIQPSSCFAFTTLGNNSAGSHWTPWRWRLEALKHVAVN
jgi:hypothetical protein